MEVAAWHWEDTATQDTTGWCSDRAGAEIDSLRGTAAECQGLGLAATLPAGYTDREDRLLARVEVSTRHVPLLLATERRESTLFGRQHLRCSGRHCGGEERRCRQHLVASTPTTAASSDVHQRCLQTHRHSWPAPEHSRLSHGMTPSEVQCPRFHLGRWCQHQLQAAAPHTQHLHILLHNEEPSDCNRRPHLPATNEHCTIYLLTW